MVVVKSTLEESEDWRLRQWAKEQHLSVSAAVRVILCRYLDAQELLAPKNGKAKVS